MDERLVRITSHPLYHELLSKRRKIIIPLTILMLVAYYGFVLSIAFGKSVLSQSAFGGITTLGIALGLGLILFTFFVTWLFVRLTNRDIQPILDKIHSTDF